MQVLGAGALGTFVAAKLVRAGIDARLIVRKGSLKDVGKATVTVDGFTVDVPVSSTAERRGHFIVCTKAFDAKSAVATHCDTDARVLVLCNGVLAVREELPKVIPATTTHGCYETKPFHIVQTQGTLWCTDNSDFLPAFRTAGLNPVGLSSAEMNDRLWRKLALNAVINPLSAVFKCTNGNVLPRGTDDARAVCFELASVRFALENHHHHHHHHHQTTTTTTTTLTSSSSGPAISTIINDDAEKRIIQAAADKLYADVVAGAVETAGNYSSMYQDVKNRRRTEIDVMNGWISATGRRHGIPTPTNDRLTAAIAKLSS